MGKNIIDRIEIYLNSKGINVSTAEREIGLSNASLSKPFKNKTSIKTDTLEKFLKKYNDVNPSWLLLENGPMEVKNFDVVSESVEVYGNEIVDDVSYVDDSKEPEIFLNEKTCNKYLLYPDGTIRIEVLKVPFAAYASYVECFDDDIRLHEEFSTITFKVDHIGRGKYLGFESKGNSMWNNGGFDTPSGSDILGRQIGRHLWNNGFHKSKYGFILITNNGIYHKDIEKITENGNLVLSSRNPNHKSFEYPINDVKEIYHVIKRSF
ncbi:helix-turn-helix transcriptional regulator [Flavobacterium sp.]|uniref:XRE family transcriptional regulator n=1 Tax=Flavobacterium sp. TaxID=239 RepID=UPI00263609C9|nr:helix-turn-helix transcriptional regulator [Flavobacterium sp.]